MARFDLVVRCLNLLPPVADIPTETLQAAFDRAHAIAGRPWMSAPVRDTLMAYAAQAPVNTAARRRERIDALVAFMLGGPDGQVM